MKKPMSNPNSIVRLQFHRNRTPTGRPSATAARKLAHYLAYGRGRPAEQAQRPQRGIWFTETGQTHSHEEVLAWVAAQGKSHGYTYQLLLSVKEADLTAADYLPAMTAGGELFSAWRLITHRDTDHSHAHVLAFGDAEIRVMGRPFRDWWQAARQDLAVRQEFALQAAHQETAAGMAVERSLTNRLSTREQLPALEMGLEWDWEV